MRLAGIWTACWAFLVALAQAQQNDSVLQAPTLRGSAGAAPDEIAALKKQITSLSAEKKGLVIAVRRLLKANQTEAQKKMLGALRGAKLKVEEAAKRTAEVEKVDKAQIAKLEKSQVETEEKLKEQMTKFDELARKEVAEGQHRLLESKKNDAESKTQAEAIVDLRAQLAKTEAALAALRKKGEDSGSKRKELEAKVAQLKEQNAHLEDETMGLESTVQKLWNVNASAEKASLLKTLDDQELLLKVVNATKVSEEAQFAQERSDLSWKLSDKELKLEVDAQAIDKLKADSERQQEEGVKVTEDLKQQNKKLAVAILKERKKGAEDVQAVQKSLKELQTRVQAEEALNQKLQTANEKLSAESDQRSKDMEKMKVGSSSNEHAFAQELVDLQRKVNDTQALVRQKDAELQEAKRSGMEFYGKQWEKTEAALKSKIALGEKGTASLEAKLADLSNAQKQKESQIAELTKQNDAMHSLLKQEEQKLAFAVDRENSEMAHVDKLEAENRELKAALEKEKEIEPKLQEVIKHDQALETDNRRLAAAKKSREEQLNKLEMMSEVAVRRAKQQQSKLDFAVDQENTEMLAVKILQGENQKLKEASQNQTELQSELQQAKYAEKAKDLTIKGLNAQNSDADKAMFALKGQVSDLKRSNGLLEDQYVAERTKLQSIVDQDSTASLAVKVLQGENQKLKQQVEKAAEDEAEWAQASKKSQARVAATDELEANRDSLQREMAAMRVEQDALKLKNGQLEETVVSLAGKDRDETMLRKFGLAIGEAAKPMPARETPRINGLEQANSELNKLMSQLRSNHQEETAKVEDEAEGDDV